MMTFTPRSFSGLFGNPLIGAGTGSITSAYSVYIETSACTKTLPAATGSGAIYIVKIRTSSVSATVTINRSNADTIIDYNSGFPASSTTVDTDGEEVWLMDTAATNWDVICRRIPSFMQVYSPTITGFGSVSNTAAYWKREGDSLFVNIYFSNGTNTTVLGSISLPSGLAIDSNKLRVNNSSGTGPIVGSYSVNGYANQLGSIVTATTTSTSVVYFGDVPPNTPHLTPQLADSVISNSAEIAAYFKVPISGWNG